MKSFFAPSPGLLLPTDRTRILSVAGTANGRIFLGGNNGCLYEMMYDLGNMKHSGAVAAEEQALSIEERLDQFYDQDKNLAPRGDRRWTPLLLVFTGSPCSQQWTQCCRGGSLRKRQSRSQ